MKKLSIFITIAAMVLVLPGCNKSYFDINDNPNSSTNASVDLVIANALKTTAGFQSNNYSLFSEWMCYWAPSGSYAMSSADGASYYQNDLTGEGFWTNYYRNLEDYEYVEKTASAQNQFFYVAAAKTMKALAFSQLVDMFNNIPYSEALQGTSKLTPKYDAGQSVYEALSTQLGAAVLLFQRGDAVGSATQDVMFHGDNAKWAQFANTLRLRLLMRQTEMPGRGAYIQAEINKIIANGSGFLTVNAAVNPGYSNSTGKQNPMWGFCYNTGGTFIQDFWRAAAYVITFCQTNNDPRYTRLYAPLASPPNPPNTWVGTVQGSGSNPVGSLASTFGPGILKSVAQDAIILSAAESYLLQAEAMFRGWLAGSAATTFNNGVQASFTELGAGSAAGYTSQNNVETNFAACTNDAQRLACIIRQRWMANNSITPFEAWADYRRLGLPNVPISVSPFCVQYKVPTRILYPRSEAQTNAANLGQQGTISHFTSKIFWRP